MDLNYIQDLWNNSVAFANTTGVSTILIALGYMFVSHKLRKKNNAITIDVNQSTEEVKQVKSELTQVSNTLSEAVTTINSLKELLFVFANSTKISDTTKKELASIFASTNTKPISEVVETVKTTAKEVAEEVKEVGESIIDQYRKELNG